MAPYPPPPPRSDLADLADPAVPVSLAPLVQRAGLLGAVLACTVALLACLLGERPLGGQGGGAWLAGYLVLAGLGALGLKAGSSQVRSLLWLLVPGAGLMVAGGALMVGAEPMAAGLPLLVWLLGLSAALGATGLAALGTGGTLLLLLVLASPLWPAPLRGLPSAADAAAAMALPAALLSPATALLLASAVLGAVGLGALVGELLTRQRQQGRQAAQGLNTLRALATDAHWHTDASLRLTGLAWRDRHGRFVPVPEAVGRRPWDLAVLRIHPDTQDLLRADAEARDPLRHLPLAWRCPDGQLRHFLISGLPRFDAQGRFSGYWGVARDITAVRAARAAMRAGEQRFEALFRRIPTPLLLLRHGRVLQANASAADLLGYDGSAALKGHDLLAEHMDDEQRDLALDRLDELQSQPDMEMLPAMPRRLLRRDGQPVYTLATAWRADQPSGPAVLALFIDQSGPQMAAQDQQRGQAVLSRVLALSQDSITLSTFDSGQCLMANDAFLRLSGHSRAELAEPGQQPLATWPRPQDRQRLVQAVQAQGVVRDLPLDLLTAHGQRLVLMMSAAPVQQGDDTWLLTLARDVSLPHRLRQERDAVLALAPVGILLTRRGRVVLANAAAERLLGWPPGGLVGQPTHLVWPTPKPRHRPAASAAPQAPGGDPGAPDALGRIVEAVRADGSSLPLRTLSRAIDTQHPDDGTLWLIDTPLALPSLAPADGASAPPNAPDPSPLAGTRVLLVEDDPVNTMVVQALLEDWGVEVTAATDGLQAVQALSQAQRQQRPDPRAPFDLVLMDLTLPGMNGFETTAALRRHHSAQALPVVAFSAEPPEQMRRQAEDLGMAAFVSKPADPEHLLATLRQVLGPRQLGQALAQL